MFRFRFATLNMTPMTIKKLSPEQLFQELVLQDPSFASDKNDILWLLKRMTQHTPSVSIDPLFQKNLKSRLEYHIQHSLWNQPHQPIKNLNRLARLISYGLPTIAIGVIVFLVLPWTPGEVIAPTSDNSMINIQSWAIPQDGVSQTDIWWAQNTNPKTTNQNSNESLPNTETRDIPMMTQEMSNLKIPDTTNLQDNQSVLPKIINNNLEARSSQTFSDDNFTITYTLEAVGDDIIIKGTLSDWDCKSQYNFSKTLVWFSKDWSLSLSTMLDWTKTSQSFTVKFQDNSIISIQWEHICQISRETK